MVQYLWIIFSITFLVLSAFHFYESTKVIKKPENKAQVKSISGVNLGINEFIADFGKYIDDLNKQNKTINLITATGYLAAFLTSLYSYYLSFSTK